MKKFGKLSNAIARYNVSLSVETRRSASPHIACLFSSLHLAGVVFNMSYKWGASGVERSLQPKEVESSTDSPI